MSKDAGNPLLDQVEINRGMYDNTVINVQTGNRQGEACTPRPLYFWLAGRLQ
jgi:hypothetical protein